MKDKILKLLYDSDDYISGAKISETLGISRQAVWKHINSIRKNGYMIESINNKGYKILAKPDVCDEISISEYLKTKYLGRQFLHFDELDSTNAYIKKIATDYKKEGLVVLTEKQLAGRGRLGRKWFSQNSKGIWMSMMLRPKISIFEVSKITQVVAAAVASALADLGIDSKIKWPNDIIINDKKICGILVEMNSEENHINHIVIGIGLNINQDKSDFDSEIIDIASSLKIEMGKTYNRAEIMATVLNKFEKLYDEFCMGNFEVSRKICSEKSYIIGSEIYVINNGEKVKAIAKSLNEDGKLLVEYESGQKESLIYGEVSVRLK